MFYGIYSHNCVVLSLQHQQIARLFHVWAELLCSKTAIQLDIQLQAQRAQKSRFVDLQAIIVWSVVFAAT